MSKKRPRKRPFSMMRHVVKGGRRFGAAEVATSKRCVVLHQNHQSFWAGSPCAVIVLA